MFFKNIFGLKIVFLIFSQTKEEVEQKFVIESTSLDASQNIIVTNNDGPQSMPQGVATQTRKYRRSKKIDIPLISPNVTTNDDAPCTSTPMDVDKYFFFSQLIPNVVQQYVESSLSLVQLLLETTFVA